MRSCARLLRCEAVTHVHTKPSSAMALFGEEKRRHHDATLATLRANLILCGRPFLPFSDPTFSCRHLFRYVHSLRKQRPFLLDLIDPPIELIRGDERLSIYHGIHRCRQKWRLLLLLLLHIIPKDRVNKVRWAQITAVLSYLARCN